MKTTLQSLARAYYQPGTWMSEPARVASAVRDYRNRRFHWPARERGISPGWGNRATRRLVTMRGGDWPSLAWSCPRLASSAARLFLP
jgi:hypothetical protein